jgi:hypothetical protein
LLSNQIKIGHATAWMRTSVCVSAALGANGILLQRVYDVSAGGLAIGGGGFGYSGHSFYGGGGTVGGLLINHRVQAAAIHVR